MDLKERLTKTNFPRDEYPQYFALYDHKPIILSRVETPQLRKAVERLIEAGICVALPIKKITGEKDYIIRWREPKK